MAEPAYRFTVVANDRAEAGRAAQALADRLRELDGVAAAERERASDAAMDLGTVVTALAGSGSTLAIAHGIASWLRQRRAVSLRIERDPAGRLKAAVSGLDPAAAVRIIEELNQAQ